MEPPQSSLDVPDVIYTCRRCRQPLFKKTQVIAHQPNPSHTFSHRRIAKEVSRDPSAATGPTECTSYFISEALVWMKASTKRVLATSYADSRNGFGSQEASSDVEGKLSCPKCQARLGMIRWAGGQCSCGTWINPAIQVSKSAVDERIPVLLQSHLAEPVSVIPDVACKDDASEGCASSSKPVS